VKEDMRKVNVLYVFGSGVVVLVVAVVANNPVVSRRAISQPPGAESLSCSSRSQTEAVLAPQSATRPIVSLFNLTPISHFTPCSLRTMLVTLSENFVYSILSILFCSSLISKPLSCSFGHIQSV
jgi:hypothetical protein